MTKTKKTAKKPKSKVPRTFQELMEAINEILPNGTLGDDNDGQVIIYTDLKLNEDETLTPFDGVEEEDA